MVKIVMAVIFRGIRSVPRICHWSCDSLVDGLRDYAGPDQFSCRSNCPLYTELDHSRA